MGGQVAARGCLGEGSYWTWKSLRPGKLMDFPPTPRDGLIQMIGRGKGRPETRYPHRTPSPWAYLGGTGGEEKQRRARLVQKVKVLIWMLSTTLKFPDLKTQHSGGLVLVICKANSSGSH